MHVQRQTYAQTVEYDLYRSYIIAASFQLFNEMALALDQCANFNSALCLWSFHGYVRDFGKLLRSVFEGCPSRVVFCLHYLKQALLRPLVKKDRVPSSSGPMTGAQQWEKKSAQSSATTELPGNALKCPFRVKSGHCDRSVRCPPNRWGNRPALLWIAEDFGCCASG